MKEEYQELLREIERVEKDVILDALAWTGGRVPLASRVLGVGHSSLHRMMQEHGIDPTRIPSRDCIPQLRPTKGGADEPE